MENRIITHKNKFTAFGEYQAATHCLSDLDSGSHSAGRDPMYDLRVEHRNVEEEKDSSESAVSLDLDEIFNVCRYKLQKRPVTAIYTQTTGYIRTTIFRHAFADLSDQRISDKRLQELIAALYDLHRDYSSPNWDGYGASPLLRSTRDEALRFIRMIPSDLPVPEASAEPTGAIAFEWYRAKDHLFIASVSGKGIVEYAGLQGLYNKSYGSERIESTFPKKIAYHIRLLFED